VSVSPIFLRNYQSQRAITGVGRCDFGSHNQLHVNFSERTFEFFPRYSKGQK